MSHEVSQMKKTTYNGTRGIPAQHQVNLPSIYQQYLGQKVWDYTSPRSWHIDTILKLVWNPEIQARTYETGVYVLQQILKNHSITRADLRSLVEDNSYSWVTARNIIIPRLKRLGMVRESKVDRTITPSADFTRFFRKLAEEWMREVADYGFG